MGLKVLILGQKVSETFCPRDKKFLKLFVLSVLFVRTLLPEIFCPTVKLIVSIDCLNSCENSRINRFVRRAAAIYDILYLSRYAIFFCHIAIQMCTGIDGVARDRQKYTRSNLLRFSRCN